MESKRVRLISLILVGLLLIVGSLNCPAQVSYCFKSSDKYKLHLRFSLIDEDWKYGFVRYNKPQYGVPIRLLRTTVLMTGGSEYVWEELRGDTVTGLYSMQVLGSMISNVVYIRSKDEKRFLFEETHTGFTECECNW